MNVFYETYTVWIKGEPTTTYHFCVGGEWDTETLFLDEALIQYPKNQYIWNEFIDEDGL